MMMKGRHFKEALFRQLEISYLQNNRKAFENVDEAEEQNEKGASKQKSTADGQSTEEERAAVAHKDFGGVSVEGEKAKTTARFGGAENGKRGNA